MKKTTPKRKRHGTTKHTKALIAASLAARIGYLTLNDFPDPSPFNRLPTQFYGPHKIIRYREGELFLITRGLVEVWHVHHDLLIKQLPSDTLFGEMPLLGQTMVTTQALASDAGATVAVMNAEQVRALIAANALPLAEKLYPRLAALTVEHYRASFQLVGQRLAALLLALADEHLIVRGLTHRQLGERIGVMRETVTSALDDMKEKKYLSIGRMETTILNRQALEELSRM